MLIILLGILLSLLKEFNNNNIWRTWNICIIIMFVTYKQYLQVCFWCLHTKFHTPKCDDSLAISGKLKAKQNVRMVAILFLLHFRKEMPWKLHIFSTVYYHTIFQDSNLFTFVSYTLHKLIRLICCRYRS